jgi:pentatricopeptide repeat protein
LIVAHARSGLPKDCERILGEMKDCGIEADIVTVTAVIDAFKRAKNIDKCWEIFESVA